MAALKRVLRVGEDALWDSLAGMVPCKVEAIEGESGRANSSQRVTIRVTKDHGPYRADERQELSALWVVPKGAFQQREHGASIRPYEVEVPAH